jgi:hypothetical protein
MSNAPCGGIDLKFYINFSATKQLKGMLKTIKQAKARKAPALRKFHTAFGKKADINLVEDRIKTIQNTPLRVHSADPALLNRLEGHRREGAKTMPGQDPNRGGNVLIGSGFYEGRGMQAPRMKAHALIHEAAHQHFLAGDNIDTRNKKVIKMKEQVQDGNHIHTKGGCKFFS